MERSPVDKNFGALLIAGTVIFWAMYITVWILWFLYQTNHTIKKIHSIQLMLLGIIGMTMIIYTALTPDSLFFKIVCAAIWAMTGFLGITTFPFPPKFLPVFEGIVQLFVGLTCIIGLILTIAWPKDASLKLLWQSSKS